MEMKQPERILYTVTEVMKILGSSRNSVYNILRSGELRSIKIGKSRRIVVADFDQYIKDRQEAPYS